MFGSLTEVGRRRGAVSTGLDPEWAAVKECLSARGIEDPVDGLALVDWCAIARQSAGEPTDDALVSGLASSSRIETSATVLSAVADFETSNESVIDLVKAHGRVVSHHQARMLAATMRVVSAYEDLGFPLDESMEAAVAELRAALHLTRRAAETHIELAHQVTTRLPALYERLGDGLLDLPRVRAIVDGVAHLDTDAARHVVDRVLEDAAALTTGQIRAQVKRLCIEGNPEQAVDRYRKAVDDRAVLGFAADDGTGTITATGLQAERVVEIMDRINRISLDLNRSGDTRSIDQIRADVFIDLLAGSKETKVGTVDILIDVDALLDLDDRAAEIPGFGPVVAELGREMVRVHGARWRAVIRDRHGSMVSSTTLRRRPTAQIGRHVENRDVTCVFPGCRMPARACDLDHLTPYRERPVTSTDEPAAVCRHDHVVRHRYGWTHRRLGDGTHEWTSPLGNRYSRPPP